LTDPRPLVAAAGLAAEPIRVTLSRDLAAWPVRKVVVGRMRETAPASSMETYTGLNRVRRTERFARTL